MGADREPSPLRGRPWGLALLAAMGLAAGLILGDRWLEVAAVTAGMLAVGLLMALTTRRVFAADVGLRRTLWLCGAFAGHLAFMSVWWMAAGQLLDGADDRPGVVDTLPVAVPVAAIYTFGLWQGVRSDDPRLSWPRFGLAADRHSQRRSRDDDGIHPR